MGPHGSQPSRIDLVSPWGAVGQQTNLRWTKGLLVGKVDKLLSCGYLDSGTEVRALMNYFSVPKGKDDVRAVFDGMKSGLNGSLWAPWFALPTVDGMMHTLNPHYWGANNDYGEMFYNYWLHPELRQFCGIGLTPLPTLHSKPLVAFTCPAMGLCPSPYQSVQSSQCLKRKVMGNPRDPENIYRWDHMDLNLPGWISYRPGEPWVSKQTCDGQIAPDLHDYVDDLRNTASTQEEAWEGSGQVAKVSSYHGTQVAA